MKTAVEWLKDTLYPYFDKEDREYTNILFEQAKEMEKEQIKRAFIQGEYNIYVKNAEQYYNETFKSE